MIVTTRGRNGVFKARLNGNLIQLLRSMPGRKKWEDRDLVFEPTGANIKFIQETFPEAVWDVHAQKLIERVDAIAIQAIATTNLKNSPTQKPIVDFLFKTKPFLHQEKAFLLSRERREFALFMEMGCGKSKVIIDNAAYLYGKGDIDALLIVAPNGVHRNWIINEFPAHMPDYIPYKAAWYAAQMKKPERAAMEAALYAPADEFLRIITMNVEAFSSESGQRFASKFLNGSKAMMVVDECFIAGTMVNTPEGERPIEEINTGDQVITSDGVKIVDNVFKGCSNILSTIHIDDGRTITCTPNHPFFTDLGWVCAANLEGRVLFDYETLRSMRHRTSSSTSVLQQILRSETQRNAASLHPDTVLRSVQETFSEIEVEEVLRKELFSQMEDESTRAQGESVHRRAEPQGQSISQGTEQPCAWQTSVEQRNSTFGRHQGTTATKSSRKWTGLGNKSRREWSGSDLGPETSWNGIKPGMEDGARHSIGREAARLSNLLQSRLGQSLFKTCDRGGWEEPQESTGSRSQKGNKVGGIRVVRVETNQRTSPCDVYNLEVRDCPHYFAGGALVHNSARIKSPGAKRTSAIIRLGKQARYRRILTGTPVTQGAEDLFSQFRFLNEDILGFSSFWSFRGRYCIMGGFEQRQIVGYRNIPELQAATDGHSFRVLKKDCLDLPEKLYRRQYVELSKKQREIYDELKKDFISEFGGQVISAPLAITRLLRMQQVICGWFPSEDGTISAIDETNPRIQALLEVIEETQGSIIIWCRFTGDIKLVRKHISDKYGSEAVVAYYGEVSGKERDEAVIRFQGGKSRFFIGNPHAAGEGLTLTKATTVVYYSNDFSLGSRLQSEDRAHRIGQFNPVTYIDFEAVNTIDKKIINALRDKKQLADMITGDAKDLVE